MDTNLNLSAIIESNELELSQEENDHAELKDKITELEN